MRVGMDVICVSVQPEHVITYRLKRKPESNRPRFMNKVQGKNNKGRKLMESGGWIEEDRVLRRVNSGPN